MQLDLIQHITKQNNLAIEVQPITIKNVIW